MRIVVYILSVTAVIFLANICYVKLGLYEQDIQKCEADLIHTFDSGLAKNNIIYFGESSNFTYGETDSCKKSISDLIAAKDSAYKILTISKGAIHAGTYRSFVARLENNKSIKAIIVTLNLRSFGINWTESDLESNLSRASLFYSNKPPIVKKFLLGFKAYDNKEVFQRKEIINYHYKHDVFSLKNLPFRTVRDWDKVVFHEGIKDASGNKDEKATDVACHFIKNYAFRLTESNPRIKDLDKIQEICNKNHIKLIYHLLPENYQKAERFFGSNLTSLMDENVNFLKNRYQSKVIFINGSKFLPDSLFIDKAWPTEHYFYKGRSKVADEINKQLSPLIFSKPSTAKSLH